MRAALLAHLFLLVVAADTLVVAQPFRAADRPPPSRPIVVSAAISLSNALTEINTAFIEAGGEGATFNFAASNVLARQIVNGAPADLFISADEAQMDYAASAGSIDPSTRVQLLRNELAVVTPAGSGARLTNVAGLAGPSIKRIAIGDPAAVPAGVYAKHYLERLGVWRDLASKLIPLANVRAALGAVESGAADAAIVYQSDAAASSRVELAFVITGPEAPVITYPAAVTARSGNREGAMRFLAFLRQDRATVIFRRYKFEIPRGEGG